jgi:hypothetical protein
MRKQLSLLKREVESARAPPAGSKTRRVEYPVWHVLRPDAAKYSALGEDDVIEFNHVCYICGEPVDHCRWRKACGRDPGYPPKEDTNAPAGAPRAKWAIEGSTKRQVRGFYRAFVNSRA